MAALRLSRAFRLSAAFGLSVLLLSARAQAAAQGEDEEESSKPADKAGKGGGAPAASGKAEAAEDTSDNASPEVPPPPADTSGPTPAAMELGPAPERLPVYGTRPQWFMVPYGYARMDAIEDSTQSFNDGIQPNLIARVGTYKGDHRRSILTARDSRIGFFIGAPTFQGIRSSAQIELDFYGLEPTDARLNDTIIFATPRLRHAFFKFETPIFDVIAGQTYAPFGFAPYYFPATAAYLGVPGEIYHRDPQIRLEKRIEIGSVEITANIAAVKPGERDSGVPDGQAGLRLAFKGWNGAAMTGFTRPTLAPFSIAVSGLYRHFEVPDFKSNPGSSTKTTNGYGIAASLLLPIIPVKKIEDHRNALTFTGEFSTGKGIADMYTGMDGGSRFPLLPNPSMATPALIYQANVDPGLVTFDQNSDLQAITWHAVMANLQYYLPIGWGRVWLSGTYSRTWSPDLLNLTPFPSWGAIFTTMEYADGNLGFDITPSIVAAVSFQTVQQTFGDVTAPEPTYIPDPNTGVVGGAPGTGGDAVTARNNRAQLSLALFF
jgi:hypothetical protein